MSLDNPRLLYVDDDEALARLVGRGLTRQGFDVVHANSGEAGLARIAAGDIDVIALDQYMPGLDGLETLERIRAIPNAPPSSDPVSEIAAAAPARSGGAAPTMRSVVSVTTGERPIE